MDTQQDRTRQEQPIPIIELLGQKSGLPIKAIPPNAFYQLLNFDFEDSYTIRTRNGLSLFMPNTTVGNTPILGGLITKFSAWTSPRMVFIQDDQLWYLPMDGTTVVPTLIGSLSTGCTHGVLDVLNNKIVLVDGKAAWSWDGTTLAAISLPNGVNPISVVVSDSAAWFYSLNDWIEKSQTNDPVTLTGGDSYNNRVSRGDNITPHSLVVWEATRILVNKYNVDTGQALMYVIEYDDGLGSYTRRPLFGDIQNPIAFVGKTAVRIGSDIIGLTPEGFTSATAVFTFNDARAQSLSDPDINDIIERINFDAVHNACGILDLEKRQYLCAIPVDSSTRNNMIVVFDYRQKRWGTYQYSPSADVYPRAFVLFNRKPYILNYDGRILKTNTGNSDLGYGFSKILQSGDLHFGSPDTLKHFKTIEFELDQDGQYDVEFTSVVDGRDNTPLEVTLDLDDGNSLWDEFYWDIDRFDVSIPATKTIILNQRGKYIRIKLRNENADEPFGVRGITFRTRVTDAGPAKP